MAGVLPYAHVGGEVYFLMGKERGGPNKGTWSMLSGGRDPTDTSNKMAASREAHEESAGLLGTTQEIYQKVHPLNGSNSSFLLEVKDPLAITNEKFLVARAKYNDPHYKEMTELKWMKAADIIDACVQAQGLFANEKGDTERVRPFVSKIIAQNAAYLKTKKFIAENPLNQQVINPVPVPVAAVQENPVPVPAQAAEAKPTLNEIHSISQIDLKKLNQDTLVLFDIDETLLIDRNHTRKNIDKKHLGHNQFIPIENNIAKMITTIKKINGEKTVLGLTKRAYSKHNAGDQQVQKLNIPFSRWRFKNLNNPTSKACFNNGVIYTAGGNKGEHLGQFLKKAGAAPKEIVMVDDREDNLHAVWEFAIANNIPVTLYHMKGADQFNKK